MNQDFSGIQYCLSDVVVVRFVSNFLLCILCHDVYICRRTTNHIARGGRSKKRFPLCDVILSLRTENSTFETNIQTSNLLTQQRTYQNTFEHLSDLGTKIPTNRSNNIIMIAMLHPPTKVTRGSLYRAFLTTLQQKRDITVGTDLKASSCVLQKARPWVSK